MNQKEVAKLRELRRLLTMENGAFSEGFPSDRIIVKYPMPFSKFEDGQKVQPTEYIKEATRLWRESWILPVLNELIAKYDKDAKKEPVAA